VLAALHDIVIEQSWVCGSNADSTPPKNGASTVVTRVSRPSMTVSGHALACTSQL
jgi:hypothetical protein